MNRDDTTDWTHDITDTNVPSWRTVPLGFESVLLSARDRDAGGAGGSPIRGPVLAPQRGVAGSLGGRPRH